jgi:peroxiredoxin (alkyl hydroperoxide reductase subunit C)
MLTIGDRLPKFQLKGVESNDLKTAFSIFTDVSAAGKWQVLFFYPKDFTFICPTEILKFNELESEFSSRNTVLYGISTDSEFVHLAWRQSHPGLKKLNFPLLSDIKRTLSSSLGILDSKEGVCLRATFIVSPEGIICHSSANGLKIGRNPKEILRILDALQTGELTPCDWHKGEKVIKI